MTRGILKIVTISGGSGYISELIEGYTKRKDELSIKEIWPVGTEAGKKKLEIVGTMTKRMVKVTGLDWEVHLTLDRETVLKGVDPASTRSHVGLLDARIGDKRILLSHGVLDQEADGTGGMSKVSRTIPITLAIIGDMRHSRLDTWLVGSVNLARMVTEAVVRHSGWGKIADSCNVPIGHRKQAAEILGIPEGDLFSKFAGINYFHWYCVWDRKGQEQVQELIDSTCGSKQGQESHSRNIFDTSFHYEQLKDLGMLPYGYHHHYYIEDETLKHSTEEYKRDETRTQVVKETESCLFELYKDPKLDYKPKELEERGDIHYSDVARGMIVLIHGDKQTDVVVPTGNNGTITNLPCDYIVEVSGPVTAHDHESYNWGVFSPAVRGTIQNTKAMEETVIRAVINGDYDAVLHTFIISLLVPGGVMARTLLDELLVAYGMYLPNFADATNKTEEIQPETVTYVAELMESS